jgi:D-alanyl-D-alanine carboxypeptidase/D-alanyl-D-alanine-endopeptidase (penicillin-binding protein 4)
MRRGGVSAKRTPRGDRVGDPGGHAGRLRSARRRVRLGFVRGALAILSCAIPLAGQSPAALDALFDAPPFDGMHVGALVVDVATGETLYSRNPGRRFAPASNQKLLTTIAALERLGPDYRFATSVHADGTIGPEGILIGNLVVAGVGDPTLSERYHDDAEAPLRDLALQLRDSGLRRVRGDLVIDAAAWDSARVDPTWMWGDLPWGYAALGGPFVVAEGMARVEVRGDRVGDPVAIRWWPVGDPDRFTATARAVAVGDSADLEAELRGARRGVEVTGTIEAGTADTLELSVQEPVREAAAVLRRVLADHGIQVDGGVSVRRAAPPCETAGPCRRQRELARLESPALMEIVRGVMEPSQNWMAEQLLQHLGGVDGDRAGPRDGLRAMRRILQSDFGLDSLDIELRDGSGLSAYNLVTPRALIRLLQGVHTRPWATAYAAALAEPGEDDSTLERRLEGLEGRLFAKTGTITHVNSLSGYVDAADGRRLAFAFLTNGSGLRSSQVRGVIDRAVRHLADSRADDSDDEAASAQPSGG